MMTEEFIKEFVEKWVKSWNSHDLDEILSHYSDDFSIETPMALKIKPESKGILKGKDNVRAYWTLGLKVIPDLHFEVLDTLVGINSVCIYYKNTATGRKSAENMFFDEHLKVEKAFVMYA